MRRSNVASAKLISLIVLFELALCPGVSAQFNPIHAVKNALNGAKQQQQQKNAQQQKAPTL
jgi:hypothetical protein